MSLPLGELLEGTKILRTGGEPDILAVRIERRQIAQGDVFFKLRSSRLRLSAADAIRRGAACVVLEAGDEEEAILPPDFPYAVVDDVNGAYARTCSRLFEAHRQLTLIGVTGAKGKTTVCHLIDAALRASGIRTGLVSSLVFRLPDSERPTAAWAPDTLTIHGFLAALREQGGTHAVIELASIGIAEDRLYGLQFDALAFTNHDADDAHMAVNRRLFTDRGFYKSSMTLCAFNSDDPAGRELAKSSPGRVVTFGFGAADVTPERYASDRAGISMRLNGHDLRFPLIGRRNAENVLAAAAIIAGILPSEGAAVHLQIVQPLPGRLERLPAPAGIDVYLDQPYMPANIEASLAAVREFAGSRRIVCVIGCAGGVDRALRPLRATAAVNAADFCILTMDDPRDEHPGSIVMDMLKGLRDAAPDRWKTILHRPTAIAVAIREASPDGIVVLMGRRANGAELRSNDRHLAMDVLHELVA
ncbi:MAG: UDP-N-acetylmuramoyl-L-alanyl-D-glutamate--2,6-diaminopimelate ligase [Thermoanaerobaculia bacterium]|nr:UDP-N-acetylmuramoyl-L-alanyl-D-glutamate--2,6-diaminopimelate ligase [Thermoanaerobaculia bacterium]